MKKWTTTIILSGVLALATPVFHGANTFDQHGFRSNLGVVTQTLNETTTTANEGIRFSNKTLESKLKSILGLSSTENLSSDSLINSPIFNNSDSSKNLRCLDLSNTGIKDICELRQFIWPQTLNYINLAGNNISNADFEKIKLFDTYTAGNVINITANGESYDIFVSGMQIEDNNISDSITISNINLMLNDINLSNLSNSDLNNSKYLFGVQGISNLDSSNLIFKSEMTNAKYYFKDSDLPFISYSLEKNNISKNFLINSVSPLSIDDDFGSISLSLSLTYYKDWKYKNTFYLIDIQLSDSVSIERKSPFSLSDITITKSPKEYGITTKVVGEPDTSKVGLYTFYLRATYVATKENKTLERDIEFNYSVKDTTPPKLSVKGSDTIYWSKNKNFDFSQGITALDSGDAITEISTIKTAISEGEIDPANYTTRNQITVVTNLDITKLSEENKPYFIKYFCTDASGNSAEVITRHVYIEEQALDTLVLRCNSSQTIVDEEIVLEIKPDNNIKMENYSGFTFEYKWYVDGKYMYTTTGDFNAKSTQTFTFDSIGMKEVKVELTAKKDSQEILLTSDTLYLEISAKIDNTQIVLISFAVAVLLIIMFFSIRVIVKVRKSKKTITKKSSTTPFNGSGTSNANKPNITIIQGVNPRNQGSGGNANSRPPENGGSDML